jgi:hypothetical protein
VGAVNALHDGRCTDALYSSFPGGATKTGVVAWDTCLSVARAAGVCRSALLEFGGARSNQ